MNMKQRLTEEHVIPVLKETEANFSAGTTPRHHFQLLSFRGRGVKRDLSLVNSQSESRFLFDNRSIHPL